MNTILSLDMATKKTGFAVFYDNQLIDYGIFLADKDEINVHTRILTIRKQILEKIKEHNIKYIIAEQVPINIHSNLKTGGDLLIMQGVLLSLAEDYNLFFNLLSPTQWRSILNMYNGTREGKKRDYQKQKAVDIVNKIYEFDFKYYKTDSKTRISDDDKAEAILLALAYLKILKENENE